jgi:hypothetical protein
MYQQDQINTFIEEQTGIFAIKQNDDLLDDHGICGDDFHELMDAYAKRFHVDMTAYLWYFHADEEGAGTSAGSAFFKPPYERVTRIPVTPALLRVMANKGRWELPYPPHRLPRRRWDFILNQVLILAALAWVLYSCLS